MVRSDQRESQIPYITEREALPLALLLACGFLALHDELHVEMYHRLVSLDGHLRLSRVDCERKSCSEQVKLPP